MIGTPRSFAGTPEAGARRLRPARRDAACRAADRIGVSQCLLHGAVRRHQPQAIRRRHADGASAPRQRVPPDRRRQLHHRDGERRTPHRIGRRRPAAAVRRRAQILERRRPRKWRLGPISLQPGPVKGVWHINHGGGGHETRMVCGFLELSEFLFAPVFRSLPPLCGSITPGDDQVSAVHHLDRPRDL